MLSSTGGGDTNYCKATITLKRLSSSVSSKSSSTSSSPSPFSPPHMPKTMEEVWKDINLASLHDNSSREGLPLNPRLSNPHNSNSSFILQDFFATPFSKNPSTNRVSTNGEAALYGSPLPPPASTILSLNSGPEFDFIDSSDPPGLRPNSRLQSNAISTFNCPFEALASSSSLGSLGKRRVQESEHSSSGDRRHKRMIKNRESAARSRARKQAYTNELELEVAHLMKENAKLKRQEQQLRVAAAAQLSKKRTLQRTSTAPF